MWPSVHNFVSRCYASFMAERLGILIYRLGNGVAVLMVVLGGLMLFSREPLLSIVPFVAAAVAWGIGRAARYVLAGE